MQCELFAVHCPTSFGLAQLNDVSARRCLPKVMIESHYAVDLGAGQIERFGNNRHGRWRYIAQPVLHIVQHLDQGPRLALMGRKRKRHLLSRVLVEYASRDRS
jgi:hypothetical protein